MAREAPPGQSCDRHWSDSRGHTLPAEPGNPGYRAGNSWTITVSYSSLSVQNHCHLWEEKHCYSGKLSVVLFCFVLRTERRLVPGKGPTTDPHSQHFLFLILRQGLATLPGWRPSICDHPVSSLLSSWDHRPHPPWFLLLF